MSDTIHNVKSYVGFTSDEFISMTSSSALIAFIVSMRDLLFEHWGEGVAVQRFGFTFVFLLFSFIITVWACKILAIRLGYVIRYHAHYVGLLGGAFLCVASAGYLPVFLPGGFTYEQPERLAVGKWRGYRKDWEVGLIAASFPLFMVLWVLLLSPLYLVTQTELYMHLMGTVMLIALFACIPMVNFRMQHSGKAIDWWRYFRGTTFGLDVAYISRPWWCALCVAILLFWFFTYLLTFVSITVGIFTYCVSLALAGLIVWIYCMFFYKE
jgi:hypothetical protein